MTWVVAWGRWTDHRGRRWSVVEGASGGEGGAADALLRGAGPRHRGVPCRVVVSARIRPRVRARVRAPGAKARAGTRAVRPRPCGHGPTDIGQDAVRESGSRKAVASRGLAVHRPGHLWLRRGDRRDGGGRGGRGVAWARGGVGGSQRCVGRGRRRCRGRRGPVNRRVAQWPGCAGLRVLCGRRDVVGVERGRHARLRSSRSRSRPAGVGPGLPRKRHSACRCRAAGPEWGLRVRDIRGSTAAGREAFEWLLRKRRL
jgi:hypothetical protein